MMGWVCVLERNRLASCYCDTDNFDVGCGFVVYLSCFGAYMLSILSVFNGIIGLEIIPKGIL